MKRKQLEERIAQLERELLEKSQLLSLALRNQYQVVFVPQPIYVPPSPPEPFYNPWPKYPVITCGATTTLGSSSALARNCKGPELC
jgi:hypothetical protein